MFFFFSDKLSFNANSFSLIGFRITWFGCIGLFLSLTSPYSIPKSLTNCDDSEISFPWWLNIAKGSVGAFFFGNKACLSFHISDTGCVSSLFMYLLNINASFLLSSAIILEIFASKLRNFCVSPNFTSLFLCPIYWSAVDGLIFLHLTLIVLNDFLQCTLTALNYLFACWDKGSTFSKHSVNTWDSDVISLNFICKPTSLKSRISTWLILVGGTSNFIFITKGLWSESTAFEPFL